MLIDVQKEREISSLEDLRYKREQLVKKAKKKQKKLKKRVKKLSKKVNSPIIYDEILSQFDLQHSLMNMLPLILKYRDQLGGIKLLNSIKNSPSKRRAVITLGAVGAGLWAYFSMPDRKKKNKETRQEPVKKQKKTSHNNDELFV